MGIEAQKNTHFDILKINDPNFTQRNVCIVTGCGSIIGSAVAIAAAVNGLMVIGVDINVVDAEKTAETAQAMGGTMRVVRADLTKNADMEKVVDAAEISGTIRYLANIANVVHNDLARKIPLDQYDFMHRLMLRAPYYLSLLVISQMGQNSDGCGVIANMATIQIRNTFLNMPALSITDSGLRGLSRSISAEGGGKVRSFTVGTGFVRTAPLQRLDDGVHPESRTKSERIAVDLVKGSHRIAMTPIDVANLFIFGFSCKGARFADEDPVSGNFAAFPPHLPEVEEQVTVPE